MPNNYVFDLNSAIKAGYTPDQVAQFLDQQKKNGNNYQLTSTPQATPQQSQQPAQPKNQWADILPTVGAVGGSFVSPILGSAVGAGLGETAKELIEGQPLNAGDIAGQAALGGVGGVGGKVLGAVAGKVLPSVGDALENGSENLALKTLRPTKTQLTNYSKIHGEDMGTVIQRNNLVGQDAQGIQEKAIQPLQDQFNGIVNNQTIPVPQSTLDDRALSYVDTLLKSPSSEDHTLADNLLTDYDFATKQLGDNPTLADINKARQTFDSKVSDWKNDPIAAGKNRLLGNIFRGATQDVAGANGLTGADGQPIQQMGQELSKLYGVKDIAELQGNMGRGNLPIGLTTILGGGAGSLTGIGGVPGAIAGATAVKLLNNPKAVAVYSNLMQKAGQGLQNGITPNLAGTIAGRTAIQSGVRSVFSPGGNNQPNDGSSNSTNNNTNQNTQNMLPPSPSQAGDNSTISGAQSQALPATPGGAFGSTSTSSTTTLPDNPNSAFQSQPPANFMKGYTVNGQPVDPATANMLWQVVNYRIDPTKMTSLKNNERQQLISLASQYDPSYTSSQYPVVEATRKDFTSGKSAQSIRSLNTAIGHLNALSDAGKALGNGKFPIINSAKNEISSGTGQPAVGRFNTAANAVAGEMAQVFKSSGATDTEIQDWKSQISPNMSPAQLQASINQMISLMGSRLSSLQSQYSSNVGKPADFSFISPESQKILQGLGIDPTTLTSSDNNLPANP